MKIFKMIRPQAEEFYSVHQGRPFYDELIKLHLEGPVVALALEREDAVEELRYLIGGVDPSDARPNTLRAKYGKDIANNAIYASDSAYTARRDLGLFFSERELSY